MSHTTPTAPLPARLSDLPLWRLLVALDDAERSAGPDSGTARVLARAIQERLRGERDCPAQEVSSAGR
jgi:hypothetical protein